MINDVAVTSPARTVVDITRTRSFEQAVALADAALHRHLITPGALAGAVERASGWRGAPAARRVVHVADPRSESVGESRSRVAIARAGLPVPELQWRVQRADGLEVGKVDFWWRGLRVVGEFDGAAKYGRLLRPGKDPREVLFREKLREDAIRAENLRMARWTWPELDDFAPVAARITRR